MHTLRLSHAELDDVTCRVAVEQVPRTGAVIHDPASSCRRVRQRCAVQDVTHATMAEMTLCDVCLPYDHPISVFGDVAAAVAQTDQMVDDANQARASTVDGVYRQAAALSDVYALTLAARTRPPFTVSPTGIRWLSAAADQIGGWLETARTRLHTMEPDDDFARRAADGLTGETAGMLPADMSDVVLVGVRHPQRKHPVLNVCDELVLRHPPAAICRSGVLLTVPGPVAAAFVWHPRVDVLDDPAAAAAAETIGTLWEPSEPGTCATLARTWEVARQLH